jgi:hypothetical protein
MRFKSRSWQTDVWLLCVAQRLSKRDFLMSLPALAQLNRTAALKPFSRYRDLLPKVSVSSLSSGIRLPDVEKANPCLDSGAQLFAAAKALRTDGMWILFKTKGTDQQ